LLYTTGGLAYGQDALNTNFVGPGFSFPASTTVTKVGWIAGIGTEGVFAGNWSAKLEALYYNLGTTTLLAGPALGAGLPGVAGFVHGKNFETDGVIVRGGVNLKLGW
jgi:outer membrane immunogenic protein